MIRGKGFCCECLQPKPECLRSVKLKFLIVLNAYPRLRHQGPTDVGSFKPLCYCWARPCHGCIACLVLC